jgi:hypothetical protein
MFLLATIILLSTTLSSTSDFLAPREPFHYDVAVRGGSSNSMLRLIHMAQKSNLIIFDVKYGYLQLLIVAKILSKIIHLMALYKNLSSMDLLQTYGQIPKVHSLSNMFVFAEASSIEFAVIRIFHLKEILYLNTGYYGHLDSQTEIWIVYRGTTSTIE